jgi:hypothetical protein
MCFFQDTKCGACERDRAGTMVQMYGQPYHPNTLKTVPPDDQASLNRVRIVIVNDWAVEPSIGCLFLQMCAARFNVNNNIKPIT